MSETTKARYTPGPWRTERETWQGQDAGERHVIVYGGNTYVADLFWADGAVEDNARLIAAAPDLLEALEELADVTDRAFCADYDEGDTRDALEDARIAIAKARGEG